MVRFVAFLPGVLVWLWLFWHLHDDWSLNPQYNYGWIVPFAAAWGFWNRWRNCPAPSPPRFGTAALCLETLLLLGLLLLRVVEVANPDWRLLGWMLALIAAAVTLAEIYRAGGAGWVRHFAFAALFPLVGVPWLVRVEQIVIQSLTVGVATSAVEIAGWLGVGAFRLGNVIELHNGFVSVDEACSGVRTLQAGIMVAIFLGELFCLATRKRFYLLFSGALWAVACNVVRAIVLVVIAARSSPATMSTWHETIGEIMLVVGMAGLVAIAWMGRNPAIVQSRRAQQQEPSEGGNVGFALGATVWLALVFAAAEGWYRMHETRFVARQPWTVQWPEAANGFRFLQIPSSTRAILRYDQASSADWFEPTGVRWWAFFAQWQPSRTALQLVHSHSPDICLPATGRTFRREWPAVPGGTDKQPLTFRSYQFDQSDHPLFVFVTIQEDKYSSNFDRSEAWDTRSRLRAAINGRRNPGQRLLELAIMGLDDFSSAKTALQRVVRQLISD